MNPTPHTCFTCRHFSAIPEITTEKAYSTCHRFPPTPPHGFPEVDHNDWCGEYVKRSSDSEDVSRSKPVAIVSSLTLKDTIYALMDDERVKSIEGDRGVLKDGRPFFIITDLNDLEGHEFSDVSLVGEPSQPLLGEARRRVAVKAKPVAVVSTLPVNQTAHALAADPRFMTVDMARGRGVLRDGRPFLLVYNATTIAGLEFSAVILIGPRPPLDRLGELNSRVRP